jgi:hypothetical protein
LGSEGTSCLNCPPGTFVETPRNQALSDCIGCPTNSTSFAGSSLSIHCTCVVGYTGPDGGPCVACEAGKYKASTGSANCTVCEAGRYSFTSAGACSKCDLGKFSAAVGATNASVCSDCTAGKFSDSAGASGLNVSCVYGSGPSRAFS